MKNSIPNEMKGFIVERPTTLEALGTCRGEKKRNVLDLLGVLENLDTRKSVQMSEEEAVNLFGKTYRASVLKTARSMMPEMKVKVANDKGSVYFWAVKV